MQGVHVQERHPGKGEMRCGSQTGTCVQHKVYVQVSLGTECGLPVQGRDTMQIFRKEEDIKTDYRRERIEKEE